MIDSIFNFGCFFITEEMKMFHWSSWQTSLRAFSLLLFFASSWLLLLLLFYEKYIISKMILLMEGLLENLCSIVDNIYQQNVLGIFRESRLWILERQISFSSWIPFYPTICFFFRIEFCIDLNKLFTSPGR